MRSVRRLVHIARVLLRYRVDELFPSTRPRRLVRLSRALFARTPRHVAAMNRGQRVRLALEALGPLFVKFGQILSTRRDLLPPDVAEELALLQDRVAPFDGREAQRAVERALGQPVGALFRDFDMTPLASASIAQVHAANLPDGREVVVKVLRPGVHARVAADLHVLRTLAAGAARYAPNAERIQPREMVAEIERTLQDELDLQREGANASVLKRNFAGSDDLCVPEVIWSHSRDDVLTLERVRGIPADDIAALDAAGIDRKKLAAKGVRLFYTQVFRDNFFHADAHAGNIWVDAARGDNPRFIALDFGIMGTLPPADQYCLASNFDAMFKRDYRRIAELHLEAGWIPAHVRVDDLENAVRSVCEPYMTRPLSQISLGEVLVKLFRVSHRYELVLQPQLLLLQKTLLNVEGLGRLWDPDLDIWSVAQPVLDDILREKYGLRGLINRFKERIPELIRGAPDLPRLIHDYLTQATRGEQRLHMHSTALDALAENARRAQRATVRAVLGAGLMVSASVLWALDAPGARVFGLSWLTLAAVAGAALCFVSAWRAR
jgi:ubiquinone biosynthesis protein